MAPIEAADHLRQCGENPYSVDSYAKKYGIELPDGETHNPLYDAHVAASVYLHITNH
jgi:DNA polymerase III epsilon subunit-like protein